MIKAYWWPGGPGRGNFGDQLTPFLCERLSGQRVEHAAPHEADLIAVGSILEPWFWPADTWRVYRGFVWGAGRMFGEGRWALPAARVLAVRGHLTWQRVDCPSKESVFLGDPGLLCSLFVRTMRKRYKLGVVPHWSEREDPRVAQLVARSAEIVFIDVGAPVQEVLDQIAACEALVASSLHALIAADALGIPNEWLRLELAPDRDLGKPEFKYRDYYSLYGMADKGYLTLGPADTLETILARVEPSSRPGFTALQKNLLDAFPFRPL